MGTSYAIAKLAPDEGFDFRFNSGGAIRVLQQTINQLTGSHISEDGAMGTQTLNAMNAMNPTTLYNALKQARISYLENHVIKPSVDTYLKKHPNASDTDLKKYTQKKYENGWKNRVNSFNNRQSNESNVNCK